jgi:thiosulfate/3-mercaptopyruvate sulfurtransferase
MTGSLIAPDDLARLIAEDAERLTLLDVRWELSTGADHAAYLRGHIPGAVFVDLDRQLADPPSERGRHPLPEADRFQAEMRGLGVFNQRPVVVYDAATSTAAARGWWLLRYFGHTDVRVLDGGLAAWADAGYPVSTEATVPRPGTFVARPGAMAAVSATEAQSVGPRGVLLDARAHARYAGEVEPIDPVAGHIPGARNRPASENLAPDGRFLDGAALRSAFEKLGLRPGVPVVAYCGSGVTAAHEVLALELAGYDGSLYPGSWSEWISDPRRPVATGDEPG